MSQYMRGLVKEHRKPGASFTDVPVPQVKADEVRIRVTASSICGTDMHIYNWDAWAENTVVTPNVFGHEFCGIVDVVGSDVKHVKPGEYVSAEGHMVCGTCKACRTGKAHVCRNTVSFGITAPGCFSEYAVTKAQNVIHNHPHIPEYLACLQDPLGNAVQSVLSDNIVGKNTLIIGTGPIGLLAVAVAKACGAGKVIAADVNPYRLDLAKKMGADETISVLEMSMPEIVMELTKGEGAEVVLEMSGQPEAIQDGLKCAASGGRVSLLGIPTKKVPLDLAEHLIFKGIKIEGITGRRMYDTWYQLKGLLEQGRINLDPLVTHIFTLDQYEEAFALMQSGKCGKIVFDHRKTFHSIA